jgi:hypothetical protein
MAPTTITSIVLVLFALFILSLTAYGYYLVLCAGASVRDPQDDPPGDIDAAVHDFRRQIEEYERQRRDA